MVHPHVARREDRYGPTGIVDDGRSTGVEGEVGRLEKRCTVGLYRGQVSSVSNRLPL